MILREQTLIVGKTYFREVYLSVLLFYSSELSLSFDDSTGLEFALAFLMLF
jgi:hypothetical protein